MVVTLMTLLPRFSSPEVKQVILIVFSFYLFYAPEEGLS